MKPQLGALPTDLGSAVAILVNVVATIMDDEVGPSGLTALEFSILKVCLATDGCTARDITEIIPIDASRVSRCVEKLVNMGLLRRRRLRTDRRLVRLEVSEKGRATTLELSEKVDSRENALLEEVTSEELKGFIATSQKVIKAFAAEEATRPPRSPRPSY